MRTEALACSLFALLVTQTAAAQDSSTAGALQLYGTFTSIGVRLPVSGDDDADAVVTLAYRAQGEASWRAAYPLQRVINDRFFGSLFFLEAGVTYEVQATLQDPDNGADQVVTASVQTRAEPVLMPASPTHLYVNADGGSDGADGLTPGSALATVGEAASRATAGTVVHVAAGTYHEAVEVPASGAAGSPIVFLAEPGAVLDGSHQAISAGAVTWTLLEDGIYYTSFDQMSWYAAWGTTRLYDYPALDDLRAETGGQSGQSGVLPGGFFVDESAQRLYVRLPDRSDPNGEAINVAVLRGGFLLDGREQVVIDGFELRFFGDGEYSGYGVDLRGSSRCVVRANHIHNNMRGIRVRNGGEENLIERNVIWDTSIWSWPWSSVKAHTGEASAVGVNGGWGNVVRHNQITGIFNGVYVGEFTDTPSDDVAAETDVYGNVMQEVGDDGLEPEGACINVRFFDNTIGPVFNAISLAPIQVGPTWLVNNLIRGYKSAALKLNNGSSGPILVFHNTAVPLAGEGGAQAWNPSIPFGPLTARNNIWAAHRYVIEYGDTSLLAPVDMDYDDLWTDFLDGPRPLLKWLNVRYDTLADFVAATGLEEHGFNIEPVFEDAAGGDYRLIAGHALLDQGIVLPGINDLASRVPDGMPDLGAVERGGGTLPDAGLPDMGMADVGMADDGSLITDDGSVMTDAGGTDGGMTDDGSGMTDGGMTDDRSVMTDSGMTDAGGSDASLPDAEERDFGGADAGLTDGGVQADAAVVEFDSGAQTGSDDIDEVDVAPEGCACGATAHTGSACLVIVAVLGLIGWRRRRG